VLRGKRLRKVYLVYVDDSSDNSDYCVIGAAILRESDFSVIEGWMAHLIETYVPEELRSDFEFHASALFNGKPPFHKIPRQTAMDLMQRVVAIMAPDENPGHYFVYGAVNLRVLRRSYFSTAQPQDVAFRICLDGLKKFFTTPGVVNHDEMALMICDDTSNQHVKKNFQQSYRAFRGRARPSKEKTAWTPPDYFHDDMYFGDSSHSVGLQVADICSYIVLRHLLKEPDTEFMYEVMAPRIFHGAVEPESATVVSASSAISGPVALESPARDGGQE